MIINWIIMFKVSSEFEFKSRYNVHFRTDTLGKDTSQTFDTINWDTHLFFLLHGSDRVCPGSVGS